VPTVAIVDGYSTGRFLAERLAAAGVRCVHVQSLKHPPKLYLKGFDPGIYARDIGHTARFESLVGELVNEGVTHVVPGNESGVVLADRLSDRLGIDGNDLALLPARTDKREMARRLSDVGLDAPRCAAFDDTDRAREWAAARGLHHTVVKPVASSGTDHVHICRSLEELSSAGKEVLDSRTILGNPNPFFLVSERLTGDEYYLNTVSVNGHHRLAESWVYGKTLGPGGAPVYEYEDPVDSSSSLMSAERSTHWVSATERRTVR
jgi:biotin carboxylase